MSNTEQLLAKAMSTSSEDEAIACLRMARKKGASAYSGASTTNSTYNGHDAKYWYDKAAAWYGEAKKLKASPGLSASQQSILYNMYVEADTDRTRLRDEKIKLTKEILELKKKKDYHWTYSVIGFLVAVILVLIQLL